MQIQKDNVKNSILDAARQAFYSKGYDAVSMREISALSGIGLSNIYNYFKNKEDILLEILSPLFRIIDSYLLNDLEINNTTVEVFTSKEYHTRILEYLINIINLYKDEFNLLIRSSSVPCIKLYFDKANKLSAELGIRYIKKMQDSDSEISKDISYNFVQFISNWWFLIMKEVVLNNKMTSQDVEVFISNYITFSVAGWKKLMVR